MPKMDKVIVGGAIVFILDVEGLRRFEVQKSGQRRDGLEPVKRRRTAAPTSRVFEVLQSEQDAQINFDLYEQIMNTPAG